MYAFRLRWMARFGPLLLLACLMLTARRSAAAQEPAFSIPNPIVGQSGQSVQVPVDFASGGHAIAGTAFSLDFDESCLALNSADSDGNGVPDGVHILTPVAFRTAVSFDANDTDGELDVTIADYAPPFATLSDQTILQLDFTVICTPAPTTTRQAPVAFALLPRPSFSDAAGRDIPGSSQDGAVNVLGAQVDTPTPTVTATSTATATPTTAATANPDATATTTATPVVTATGTVTPVITPPHLYMPLVVR